MLDKNELGFEEYHEEGVKRLDKFAEAIKTRNPEIIKEYEVGEKIKQLIIPRFEEFLKSIRSEYSDWRIDFQSVDWVKGISTKVNINKKNE